jgi:hypothetical protein
MACICATTPIHHIHSCEIEINRLNQLVACQVIALHCFRSSVIAHGKEHPVEVCKQPFVGEIVLDTRLPSLSLISLPITPWGLCISSIRFEETAEFDTNQIE